MFGTAMNRRSLLQRLGLVAVGATTAKAPQARARSADLQSPWPRLLGPIPLPSDGLSPIEQRQAYRRINLDDRLEVPAGFRSEVLLSWGDRLGHGAMGFNNDYIAFTPLSGDRALLTINFEYISAQTWCEGYAEARGRELPFEELEQAMRQSGGSVDAQALKPETPLRQMVELVAAAALEDLGIGVAELTRDQQGSWRHSGGALERRIHGLSGLDSPKQRLRSSGPGAAVFRKSKRQGYDDGLGDRVIGTFANCAGGQTPWGTILSAEENIQTQVVEAVYADGSSPSPAERPFQFTRQGVAGLGNPFGLAGNKYGWMVEVDPLQPDQPAVKHTWLGRFRHEAVAIRARAGEALVVYSGCDRHSGHLYRFVSQESVKDPSDRGNSALFENGRLEVAQLLADGSGRWLPLQPDSPVSPLRPSHHAAFGRPSGVELPKRDRSQVGSEWVDNDEELERYCATFQTLSDLYTGRGEEQMGAILIDAHLAANAIGGTPMARPEDTEIDPISNDLLITFTMGGSDESGSPDPAIFKGPQGQTPWPYGWVMRLTDSTASPQEAGGRFQWRMAATGGTPWEGGMGFANPDNLAIDRMGNVWMVTDRSSSDSRTDIFGKNSCWILPRDQSAGEALLFANGPIESELCGPCFDQEEDTLFLAVQHPGEQHGCYQRGTEEMQAFTVEDRVGNRFDQLRKVPLGSNWPSGVPGRPPRPGIVAIRRIDGGRLLPRS